jgi:hypothetical protein
MSEQEQTHSAAEKLITAYNRMMQRVRNTLDQAGDQAVPSLERNIEHAKEKAIELGELTREEAEKIAFYLRRDMQDAGEYLARTGRELGDWLEFDIDLIEDRLLDIFSLVADKTKLELMQFEQELREGPAYHTGEITGPGALMCDACGEIVHFHATGHIPPCPACRETHFHRPRVAQE